MLNWFLESIDIHCSFGGDDDDDDDDDTDMLDMDEEVMKDYLKGIGGSSELFKGTYLEKGYSHLSQSYPSNDRKRKIHKEIREAKTTGR